MKRHIFGRTVAHAANMGLAIAGGLCVIERLCFLFTFVLANSLVLLNARHRQAPNRWQQG
ncbi:hypothetical protein FW774_10910 [Pedobacter sp. BS3]|uniref:hypothetical protein n=1 Tax=Pedobacter sp. BS3 TaxID=2567937 RepID=UPI0011ED6D59|nr:hypothetical protein [Pedobacter sp. BS3]TZF83952.1 hypothetical protein FW774_10910 [Pedobacter sp. BS3]